MKTEDPTKGTILTSGLPFKCRACGCFLREHKYGGPRTYGACEKKKQPAHANTLCCDDWRPNSQHCKEGCETAWCDVRDYCKDNCKSQEKPKPKEG